MKIRDLCPREYLVYGRVSMDYIVERFSFKDTIDLIDRAYELECSTLSSHISLVLAWLYDDGFIELRIIDSDDVDDDWMMKFTVTPIIDKNIAIAMIEAHYL